MAVDHEERDLVLRLAEAGTEAETLVAFRARALELLRARVPFDRAAFHAFSPRVPLETGVFVDLDVSMLARSVGQWDAFAVELGRMRDLANASRVAWDREAFPPGSPSRVRFLALIGTPLRVRSMVIVHLIVRGTVRSVIALFRQERRHLRRAPRRLPPARGAHARARRCAAPARRGDTARGAVHQARVWRWTPHAAAASDRRARRDGPHERRDRDGDGSVAEHAA